MGIFALFFFGEADELIVKDIAREHKFDEEVVEKHYKKMLEEIKNEVENKEDN